MTATDSGICERIEALEARVSEMDSLVRGLKALEEGRETASVWVPEESDEIESIRKNCESEVQHFQKQNTKLKDELAYLRQIIEKKEKKVKQLEKRLLEEINTPKKSVETDIEQLMNEVEVGKNERETRMNETD